jgi:hypothetical protein
MVHAGHFAREPGIWVCSRGVVEEVLIALRSRRLALLLDVGRRPPVPADQRIAFKVFRADFRHARSPHFDGIPPGRRMVTAGEPSFAQSRSLRGLAAVPCPLNGGWRDAVIDAGPAWQKANAASRTK